MDIFDHYSKVILASHKKEVELYKSRFVNQNRSVLLDLLLQIMAYDCGIIMQAWKEFQAKNLEAAVVPYIKADLAFYGKDAIKSIESKTISSFESSFDNHWSKQLLGLNLASEFMHIPPKDRQAQTLLNDFSSNWLPKYQKERNKKATIILEFFGLTVDDLIYLPQLVFAEIIQIVNGDELPDKYLITFLEDGINNYFPILANDLGVANLVSLLFLRKKSDKKFNTVCHRCGVKLRKQNNKLYCTRSENRSCSDFKSKESKNRGLPAVILRTKNKCDTCGKHSSLNFIKKHKEAGILIQRQFCSNKCWETFRKRYYRKITRPSL